MWLFTSTGHVPSLFYPTRGATPLAMQALTVRNQVPEEAMTDDEFRTKLSAMLNLVPSESRPNLQRSLDILADRGVTSFESALAIVRDQQAQPNLRTTACWILGRLADKRAVPGLLVAFRDQDPNLQWEAARALGILGGKRAARPLIIAMQDAEGVETRRAAAYALGWMGNEMAHEPLLETLANVNENPRVRAVAAEALANLGDTRAVKALLSASEDPDVEVRFWSAFALGQLVSEDDSESLAKLERMVETDHALCPGWRTVSEEARSAIEHVRSRGVGPRDNVRP
jgi:HEAT repeat protein